MSPRSKIASPAAYSLLSSLHSAITRQMSNACSHRSFATASNIDGPNQVDAIFQRKRNLRTKVREALKNMSPIQRSQEDDAIQNIVLKAPWFKHSKSLCMYISSAALREVDTSRILTEVLCHPSNEEHAASMKKVYVPRVEDRFSNMRMLKISNLDDLVMSPMNILEPAPLNSDGNELEDVMQACEPVDLFILPGLAFDQSGRRLGRSGGYYDMFLKNYEELARKKSWKQPLLVALAYFVQIMDKGTIPLTPNDVPVDALVSPAGFIPISPVATEPYF